jgi:hypothetical protein
MRKVCTPSESTRPASRRQATRVAVLAGRDRGRPIPVDGIPRRA